MDLCHLTITSERDSRLPLFEGEARYQAALHRLGRVCAGRLALFSLVAEHLHLVTCTGRAEAGRLAQAVQLSLRPIARTAFAPSYPKLVESRSHMRWLLRYLLEQPRKHQMPGHPALWVGSCLCDLAGARIIPGLKLRIHEALPDFRLQTAFSIVGLPEADLPELGHGTLRAEGAHRLKVAAASALAVASRLGRALSPAAVLARRVVALLASQAGIARGEVASALGISAKAVALLERRAVPPEVLAAIPRRLSLERLVSLALTSRPPERNDEAATWRPPRLSEVRR